MTLRFAGLFGDSDLPASASPPGFRRIHLKPGYVEFDRSLSVEHVDSTVCIAIGLPRFADGRPRSTMGNKQSAAMWIDLFARHGIDAPAHVHGRFAAILLDLSERTTYLAVDRFASFPICYSVRGDTLAFANRADCIPGNSRSVSSQALFNYFYFHVIPAPQTAFDGVDRLPNAHVLAWQASKAKRHRYWIGQFEHPRTELAEMRQEFRRLVHESVARESDGGSVGCFLSGGTDSSTVAGMLTKVKGTAAKTYSMGFDVSGYDEMAYARIAARHFGTEHHEYYVTPADLLAGLPTIAVHYDQPFGNSSALPAWKCAALARSDGVEKMLAGDGGDELFGGNTRYAKQRLFAAYERIPQAARRRLVEPLLSLPGITAVPPLRKALSYVEQARVPMPDRTQMYNLLTRLGTAKVFTSAFLARIDESAPLDAQRNTWNAIDATALIDRMLAFDWKYTLADNDLPKVIGSAELAGVDVGFPLLSDELVEFSMRLRPEWKVRGFTLRWFFKEALRDFLPPAIIAKKKHGFGLPFGRWTVSDDALRKSVHATIGAFGSRNVVRPDFLNELMLHRMREHPGYYGEMVWVIAVLEHWLQAHAPDWRVI